MTIPPGRRPHLPGVTYRGHRDSTSLHPTVVPVVVQAPQPFVFVGVWTHPDYNKVAWEAMTACVAAADGMTVVRHWGRGVTRGAM